MCLVVFGAEFKDFAGSAKELRHLTYRRDVSREVVEKVMASVMHLSDLRNFAVQALHEKTLSLVCFTQYLTLYFLCDLPKVFLLTLLHHNPQPTAFMSQEKL